MSRQKLLNAVRLYFLVFLDLSSDGKNSHAANLTPSLHGIHDYFVVMNGKDVTHFQTDDRGEIWKPKVSLDRLELLQNDIVYNVPTDSCILQQPSERDNPASERKKNKSIHFPEVHKVSNYSRFFNAI